MACCGSIAERSGFTSCWSAKGFFAAPHLARANWVAVERWDVLRPREIEDELRRAHALIYEKLPKKTKAVLALPEKERAKMIRERKKTVAARAKPQKR